MYDENQKALDAALVARMANGDRLALQALYETHTAGLLSLALRLLKSMSEAEDLLHDVWLEVWTHAADYSAARGTVRTWLMMRVRSRAIDRLRAPRNRLRSDHDDDRAQEAEQHETLANKRDLGAARTVFLALPAEQRRVIDGTFFEGLTARELALRESVPIGTVKSRLHAALSRLQATLARTAEEGS